MLFILFIKLQSKMTLSKLEKLIKISIPISFNLFLFIYNLFQSGIFIFSRNSNESI